jgi:phenylalanyl-tRNA synthetase beta chain
MLCFEGISQALNIFRGKSELPNLRLLKIPESKLQTITVSEETARVRPYVAGAILRDVKFTKDSYESLYVCGMERIALGLTPHSG